MDKNKNWYKKLELVLDLITSAELKCDYTVRPEIRLIMVQYYADRTSLKSVTDGQYTSENGDKKLFITDSIKYNILKLKNEKSK